jgi:hypothetical protein
MNDLESADSTTRAEQQSKAAVSWISAIAVPIVLAVTGYMVNLTLQTREAQGKMVELAISILRSEPRMTEEDRQIRAWAVDVIEKYSGVSISQKGRKGLEETVLPGEAQLDLFGFSEDRRKTATQEQLREVAKADAMRSQLVSEGTQGSRSLTILYQPQDVDAERVKAILTDELQYSVEIKDPPPSDPRRAPTNSIWFGQGVPLKDVKLVAFTLIRAGVEISAIRPLRPPLYAQRTNKIIVGTDFDLPKSKLKVEDIQKAASFSRSFVAELTPSTSQN